MNWIHRLGCFLVYIGNKLKKQPKLKPRNPIEPVIIEFEEDGYTKFILKYATNDYYRTEELESIKHTFEQYGFCIKQDKDMWIFEKFPGYARNEIIKFIFESIPGVYKATYETDMQHLCSVFDLQLARNYSMSALPLDYKRKLIK